MQDILWEFAIVSDWTLKLPRQNIVVRNTEHHADCESAERELVQPEICHLSTPQSGQVTYALHISEVGCLTTAETYIEPTISLQYCKLILMSAKLCLTLDSTQTQFFPFSSGCSLCKSFFSLVHNCTIFLLPLDVRNI